MAQSARPETPRLYRLTIRRPSSDPKTPELMDIVSEAFLFTKPDGFPMTEAIAKQRATRVQETLPPGWEAKVTEEPFLVTHGTPAIVGTCRRATCQNFGIGAPNRFRCPECGELTAIEMVATVE